MPTRQWPYRQSCHLLADTVEELHRFAIDRLGMKPEWFQNNSRLPHYDLTVGNRFKALRLGAFEIDDEKVVKLMKAPYQYNKQYSVAGSQ